MRSRRDSDLTSPPFGGDVVVDDPGGGGSWDLRFEGALPGGKLAHPKEKASRKTETRGAAAASSYRSSRCDRICCLRHGGMLAE